MRATSRAGLLLILLAGCTPAKSEKVTSGDLQVDVRIDPDPPTTGQNHLLLSVHDATGKPVDGAQLDFGYDMPAMGAMPEMKGGGASRGLGSGKYQVDYPLAMLGDWTLELRITAPGHPVSALRLTVAPPRKGFSLERPGASVGTDGGAPLLDLPPERQQLIGVTYGTVERRPMTVTLRAPARVDVDESQLSDVTLKYDAFVEKLFVARTGQSVKAGAPLLSVYSPELLAAEQDYLLARQNLAAATPGASELLHASESRLRLWDLTPAQLADLAKRGKAEPRVTILAPAGGVVLEKNVNAGTRVMAGNLLYRIGNLGRVWALADFFEMDAPLVEVGQTATMVTPSLAGDARPGRVEFIYPTIDPKTRALQARLSFENRGGQLKPGMFVEVTVEVPLGERLTIPDAALLISGNHRYAFVERAPGKLQAVEVQTGVRAGDLHEVKSGVSQGMRVANGATFLISSEAQLRDALPRWSTP
jgi:Cu(I)/Ag(I) efflux system membrane fusion protein